MTDLKITNDYEAMTFADKYKLKEELEFIIRLNYIEKGNVDLDRLKLIIDVKKIVD